MRSSAAGVQHSKSGFDSGKGEEFKRQARMLLDDYERRHRLTPYDTSLLFYLRSAREALDSAEQYGTDVAELRERLGSYKAELD